MCVTPHIRTHSNYMYIYVVLKARLYTTYLICVASYLLMLYVTVLSMGLHVDIAILLFFNTLLINLTTYLLTYATCAFNSLLAPYDRLV